MKSFRFLATASVVCLWLATIEIAWARAGGGGGGGSGKGGCLTLVALPFFIIYSAIMTRQVRKKSKACKELLARLEKGDRAWSVDAIRTGSTKFSLKCSRPGWSAIKTLPGIA